MKGRRKAQFSCNAQTTTVAKGFAQCPKPARQPKAEGVTFVTSDYFTVRIVVQKRDWAAPQLMDAVFVRREKSAPEMATTSQGSPSSNLLGVKPAFDPNVR